MISKYDKMMLEIKDHVHKIALEHPELRAKALKELVPLRDTLDKVKNQLNGYEYKHFIDDNRRVKPIGRVGRELHLMFVLGDIEKVLGELDLIIKSLGITE